VAHTWDDMKLAGLEDLRKFGSQVCATTRFSF